MENGELLKVRFLLCLLRSDTEDATVTGIARTLNREKYAISRAAAALEKDNYITRIDGRRFVLTPAGRDAACRFDERLKVCMEHLLYEGVNPESAKQDALCLAHYCSEDTLNMVRSIGIICRAKYELRSRRQFGGAAVCRLLDDGIYELPYVIYREHVSGGSNISFANEGFDHPCVLNVTDGVGRIHLHAVSMTRRMPTDGTMASARIRNMKYFENGRFVGAEIYGDIFSFPADALNFLNYGNGAGQILHGSACLEIECPMDFGGRSHVIFALFI